MIHPLLRLVVSQPQLLAEHAQAYADLAGEELKRTATAYGARAIGGVVALVMALVFLLLGGVALMFWAVTPAANVHDGWVLIVVPAVPLVLAVIGGLMAVKKTEGPFVQLKQQVAADMSMIHQVGAA